MRLPVRSQNDPASIVGYLGANSKSFDTGSQEVKPYDNCRSKWKI